MIRGNLLGWHPFRDLLARFTATPPGRDRALALEPSDDLGFVRAALRDTREARSALTTDGPPPWAGLGDARPVLADSRAASRTSVTITLFSSDDSPDGRSVPRTTASR